MKLFLFASLLLFSSATVFAQNDAVTNAFFYQKDGKLDKAKEEIDKAVLNDKTKDKAKTWFFKGTIYQDIAIAEKPEMKALSSDPLREAFLSYRKTMTLDKKEGEYYKSSEKNIEQLWGIAFNEGVKKYQATDYAGSLNNYDLANEIKPGDTTTLLYIAYAAEAGKKFDRVQQAYRELFKQNRRTPDMYRTLSSYAIKANNSEEALKIIKEGRTYFPADKALAIDELALSSQPGGAGLTTTQIEDAIKLDPLNSDLYLVLASNFDKQSADPKNTPEQRIALKQKAIANYTKTLEIKPENVDANFNIGVFHFNEGVSVSKKLNDMSLNDYNKSGKKLEAQAKVHYTKALPYFEKCYAVSPDDKLVRQSLKRTYLGLGRKADADKIKE
jgi:tetratricopeptide (TPR) repeat protein